MSLSSFQLPQWHNTVNKYIKKYVSNNIQNNMAH